MRTTTRIAALAALLLAGAIAPATSYGIVITYEAILDGPSESPANASPGTGFAQVDWDDVARTMTVQATFSGLIGTTTAAHIHATTTQAGSGTAGVASQTPSFSTFPLGVTSGSMPVTVYDMTLASSYNPAFITANGGSVANAEVAFKNALDNLRAYFNIHSSAFPGGEIRGFLTVVPEPSTLALLALGTMGVGLLVRRRRR